MASCKPTPSTFPPTDSHWLSPHRSGFLESLAAQGYAERTVKSFRRMVDRLCAEAEARGLGPDTLDADVVGELAGACPRTGTSHMERELAMATRRFTDRLVRAGAIAAAPPTQPPPGSPEQLCAELDHWLRDHLGMFGNRLRAHRKVLRRVIEFCCTATGTAEDLAAVTPEAVFAFLDGCAGRAGWRLPHVRTILRFPFWSGRIPQDLSDAVAGPAGGHPTACPAISKPASSGSCSKPSAATARSICATTRCSCRWRAWVCGRKGNSRHLFVCVRPPYAPLASSGTVRSALRKAYRRAGLVPPRGQARTHALRHGLAMALLDGGSSLGEIGDVLRHRSARSTTAYARYDHGALRPLARPWPVPGGGR